LFVEQHPIETSNDVHLVPKLGSDVVVVAAVVVAAVVVAAVVVAAVVVAAVVVAAVVVAAVVVAAVVVVPAPGQLSGYPDRGTLYPSDGQKIKGSDVVVVAEVVVVAAVVVVATVVQVIVGTLEVPEYTPLC
jgi:hypothetical protein